jgi:hypothetical protein
MIRWLRRQFAWNENDGSLMCNVSIYGVLAPRSGYGYYDTVVGVDVELVMHNVLR